MIHISICSKLDGSAWLLWEQESILLTDDITLWLPPSLLSDEKYAVDWWLQHLRNPLFSHPTSINWTAPRRENLLSKIVMCQYIYDTYGSRFLLGKEIFGIFKLAFFFSAECVIVIQALRRPPALLCPWVSNPHVWHSIIHLQYYYVFDEQAIRAQSKLKGTAHLSAICQQLVIWLW